MPNYSRNSHSGNVEVIPARQSRQCCPAPVQDVCNPPQFDGMNYSMRTLVPECQPKPYALQVKFANSAMKNMQGMVVIDPCSPKQDTLVVTGDLDGFSGLSALKANNSSTLQLVVTTTTLSGGLVDISVTGRSLLRVNSQPVLEPANSTPGYNFRTADKALSSEVPLGSVPVYFAQGAGSTKGDIFATVKIEDLGLQITQNAAIVDNVSGVSTSLAIAGGQVLTIQTNDASMRSTGDDLTNTIGFSVNISAQEGNLLTLRDRSSTNPGLYVSSVVPALTGDVIGATTSNQVRAIRGVALDQTAPTSGQILTFDGDTGRATWKTKLDSSATVTAKDTGTNDIMVDILNPGLNPNYVVSSRTKFQIKGTNIITDDAHILNFREASGDELTSNPGFKAVKVVRGSLPGDFYALVEGNLGLSLSVTNNNGVNTPLTVADTGILKVIAQNAGIDITANDTTDTLGFGIKLSGNPANKLTIKPSTNEFPGLHYETFYATIDTGSSTNITALDTNPTALALPAGELAFWRTNSTPSDELGTLVVKRQSTGDNQWKKASGSSTGSSSSTNYYAKDTAGAGSVTLQAATNGSRTRFTGSFTADRQVTLSPVGAQSGQRIVITTLGANFNGFSMNVVDGVTSSTLSQITQPVQATFVFFNGAWELEWVDSVSANLNSNSYGAQGFNTGAFGQ